MVSTLAPGFLVAAPSLLDPSFERSLVLLIEHREEGSLGFVINRPATVTLHHVFDELGLAEEGAPRAADGPVWMGGPVAPNTGWIVFDPRELKAGNESVVVVTEKLGVSASREMLEIIARGEGPKRHMLVLGYAGWGAGQLDAELKQGSWIPVDLDEEIVFGAPAEERWRLALAQLGIDPARLMGQVPEA